jgi:hypothetical protein
MHDHEMLVEYDSFLQGRSQFNVCRRSRTNFLNI